MKQKYVQDNIKTYNKYGMKIITILYNENNLHQFELRLPCMFIIVKMIHPSSTLSIFFLTKKPSMTEPFGLEVSTG